MERYDGKTEKQLAAGRRRRAGIICLGLLLAAGAVIAVTAAVRPPEYDLGVVFVYNSMFSSIPASETEASEYTEKIQEAIEEAVGDVNGDGEVNILFEFLPADPNGYDPELAYSLGMVYFSEPDYSLFFFDNATGTYYGIEVDKLAPGYADSFDDITELGFMGCRIDGEYYPQYVSMGGSRLFAELGLTSCCAGIIDWESDGADGSARAAVRALEALLER